MNLIISEVLFANGYPGSCENWEVKDVLDGMALIDLRPKVHYDDYLLIKCLRGIIVDYVRRSIVSRNFTPYSLVVPVNRRIDEKKKSFLSVEKTFLTVTEGYELFSRFERRLSDPPLFSSSSSYLRVRDINGEEHRINLRKTSWHPLTFNKIVRVIRYRGNNYFTCQGFFLAETDYDGPDPEELFPPVSSCGTIYYFTREENSKVFFLFDQEEIPSLLPGKKGLDHFRSPQIPWEEVREKIQVVPSQAKDYRFSEGTSFRTIYRNKKGVKVGIVIKAISENWPLKNKKCQEFPLLAYSKLVNQSSSKESSYLPLAEFPYVPYTVCLKILQRFSSDEKVSSFLVYRELEASSGQTPREEIGYRLYNCWINYYVKSSLFRRQEVLNCFSVFENIVSKLTSYFSLLTLQLLAGDYHDSNIRSNISRAEAICSPYFVSLPCREERNKIISYLPELDFGIVQDKKYLHFLKIVERSVSCFNDPDKLHGNIRFVLLSYHCNRIVEWWQSLVN